MQISILEILSTVTPPLYVKLPVPTSKSNVPKTF